VLATPPGELKLEFSKSARLTALSLQKEGESEKQDIAALPKEAATVLSVPLAPLSAGKYTVNWRVVGDDNHVIRPPSRARRVRRSVDHVLNVTSGRA
jgi:methionine-rich copper-binding protein CopC